MVKTKEEPENLNDTDEALEAELAVVENEDTIASEDALEKVVKEQVKKAKTKATKKKKKTDVSGLKKGGPHSKADGLLKEIAKKYKVVIGRANSEDMKKFTDYKREPTSFPTFNSLLSPSGNPLEGGLPHGRYFTLYGPQSSGKTALAMDAIKNYLINNSEGYVMILDAENVVDTQWYQHHGIDEDRIILIPGTMALEDMATNALRVLKIFHEQEIVIGMVLIDSLGAMSPAIEMEGKKSGNTKAEANLRQDHVGTRARKIGQLLRSWAPYILTYDTCCILIAHITTDIANGGMLTISGGNALKHWSHAIVRVSRKNDDAFKKKILCKDGEVREVRVGYYCVLKLEKTRLSIFEGHTVSLPWLVGIGFQTISALFDSAVGHGVIEQKGAWYAYNGNTVAQGKAKALEWLEENLSERLEIERKLSEILYDKGTLNNEEE